MGKGTSSNWLGAPGQAIFVGFYLMAVVVTGLIFAIYVLFPKNDLVNSTEERSFNIVSDSDSSFQITGSFDPDLATVLTDTLTLQLQVVDSAETLITTTITIPANTIPNTTLLWLVIIFGALGASLHGLTSLTEYIGNRDFKKEWTTWYFLRPFVGALLALIFYFLVRAGLFKIESKDELYGIFVLAGLIGLFSKQALYKISDIFDVVFQSNKEEKLKDKLTENPIAEITNIEPANFLIETTNREFIIKGSNFVSGSKILIDNEEVSTSYTSSNELSGELKSKHVEKAGSWEVMVFNPKPGGGSSSILQIEIKEPTDENNDESGTTNNGPADNDNVPGNDNEPINDGDKPNKIGNGPEDKVD